MNWTEQEYADHLHKKTKKTKQTRQITEGDVTAAIRQILITCGIWHFKHWGGPMGERGVADIIGCHLGRMIAIEVKRPGAKASSDQLNFLKAVERAGGIGIVADNVDTVIEALGLKDRFLL